MPGDIATCGLGKKTHFTCNFIGIDVRVDPDCLTIGHTNSRSSANCILVLSLILHGALT